MFDKKENSFYFLKSPIIILQPVHKKILMYRNYALSASFNDKIKILSARVILKTLLTYLII